jgi:uncharacterized protein DUF3551
MTYVNRFAIACAALATLGAIGAATPAAAQGAWCADYSGRDGGATNCGFYTLQQCQWAVSGVGGFCRPSPWGAYRPNPSPFGAYGESPQSRRKVRRQYR